MSKCQPSSVPSIASLVRTLRDGYWDRTEVVRLPDGSLRVRKVSKGEGAPGPWGVATLRLEIEYMNALEGEAAGLFPKLLAAWDDGEHLGYEMSYVDHATDAGTLARSAALDRQQACTFQDALAEAVFGHLHVPVGPGDSLAGHVRRTIIDAMSQLTLHSEFAALIDAETVNINHERMNGPRSAMQRLLRRPAALEALDAGPRVRLHGDLFLENILLRRTADERNWPARFTLIDPVSVAGVFHGHPLFDLVKYESYATGELPAMRSEKVRLEGFDGPSPGNYAYRLCREDPAIRPFSEIDWHGRLRAAYVDKYGPIDRRAYSLLEAYFAAAMALCTHGLHRRARVLKMVLSLNAAIRE